MSFTIQVNQRAHICILRQSARRRVNRGPAGRFSVSVHTLKDLFTSLSFFQTFKPITDQPQDLILGQYSHQAAQQEFLPRQDGISKVHEAGSILHQEQQ